MNRFSWKIKFSKISKHLHFEDLRLIKFKYKGKEYINEIDFLCSLENKEIEITDIQIHDKSNGTIGLTFSCFQTSIIPYILNFKHAYHLFSFSEFKKIPKNLFKNNPQITHFNNTFWHCKNIKLIEPNVFKHNTHAQVFHACFMACTGLQKIPYELFINNKFITDISMCFSSCSSLNNIPNNLFKHNLNLKDVDYCFINCSSLTSIPDYLFYHNSNLLSILGCFASCKRLENIGNYIFPNELNLTQMRTDNTFEDCDSLTQLPKDILMRIL